MQAPNKKLGEMLVDAGLITPAQLQDALRHQKFIGGRLGSNLVALGFVSEDVLMDFLSHQMGVPRLDLFRLNIEPDVLRRIPRRLAEQLNILPVAIKEPKSLVLAMADPSDLNAIDSARFASGLTIEPVVASFSSIKAGITEQYAKIESPGTRTHEVPNALSVHQGGLEVNFDFPPVPAAPPPPKSESHHYPVDPFFGESMGFPPAPPAPAAPFTSNDDPFEFTRPSAPAPSAPRHNPPALPVPGVPMVIHARKDPAPKLRSLESYQTRTLLLGLIKLLNRRGLFTEEEFQRFLHNAVESGELRDEPLRTDSLDRPI